MTADAHRVDFDTVLVDDVSRSFGRRRALSHITFTASRGEIVGLLGPNGAGKSTMLAILATLMTPSSGRVVYASRAAGEPGGSAASSGGSEEQDPPYRAGQSKGKDPAYSAVRSGPSGAALRGRIGVLGHDLFLYPELTARENLAFFGAVYGQPDAAGVAVEALARAGLSERADDQVGTFSRGMRQRVALERALIHRPRLALLDEPFTGLDDASAASLVRRLQGLRQEGGVVVVATHDLDVAEGLLDRALFLREGRMAETVTRPEALRTIYRDVMARPSR